LEQRGQETVGIAYIPPPQPLHNRDKAVCLFHQNTRKRGRTREGMKYKEKRENKRGN
jgi:hypothetical protein